MGTVVCWHACKVELCHCCWNCMGIGTGRPKIPRSDRQCTLCDMEEVEDELHFVFRCTRLAEARKPLLLKCEECWPGLIV